MLSAETLKEHRVGSVLGVPRQDGDLVMASVQVDAADTVSKVEARELVELSCGYRCDLDPTPGTWRGQAYDAVQRNIVYNHVGLGPAGWGRAGAECAIRLDGEEDVAISTEEAAGPSVDPRQVNKMQIKGREIRVDAADEPIAREVFDGLQAEIASVSTEKSKAEARADAADAKVQEMQARLDAAEAKVAAQVRLGLETEARKVLGTEYKFDGQSDEQVRGAVIGKVFPKIALSGKGASYLEALFDVALGEEVRSDSVLDKLASPGGAVEDHRAKMVAERNKAAQGSK
jgi:hypothetical protein